MKRSLVLTILLVASNPMFAQSDLVLVDTEGTRLGILMGFFDDGSGFLQYRTFDGYIVTLKADPSNPNALTIRFDELEFESDDCSGQAYSGVAFDGHPSYWFLNGIGQVIQVGDTFQNDGVWYGQAGILDWGVSYNTNSESILANSGIMFFETGEPIRCSTYGSSQLRENVYPVRLIDLNNYGFHASEDGIRTLRLGQSSIDQSDGIFCNGFEDCPDGPRGYTSLISQTFEEAGDNCPAGGVKIQSGIDTSEDGILDPEEIESIQYVCNGISP